MSLHVHFHDAREAQVTWAQFLRKLETGEWVYGDGAIPPRGQAIYYVTVPEKKRGVHNFAGMTVMVSIIMTPAERAESERKEEAEKLEYYRSIRARQPKDEKRQVRIVTRNNAHFVSYVERDKYTQYSVAQFDARDWSVEKVKAWVKQRPDLELVE